MINKTIYPEDQKMGDHNETLEDAFIRTFNEVYDYYEKTSRSEIHQKSLTDILFEYYVLWKDRKRNQGCDYDMIEHFFDCCCDAVNCSRLGYEEESKLKKRIRRACNNFEAKDEIAKIKQRLQDTEQRLQELTLAIEYIPGGSIYRESERHFQSLSEPKE